MNRIEEIKTAFSSLMDGIHEVVGGDFDEEARRWLMAASLYIWSANRLYAETYLQALNAVGGSNFTAAQVITALDCAGEENRMLAVPGFFEEAVGQDRLSFTSRSRMLANEIGVFLASMALVNGDFTMEEAAALRRIADMLVRCCDERRVCEGAGIEHRPEMITPLSETGYHLPPIEEPEDKPVLDVPSVQIPVIPPQNPRTEPVRPSEPVKPEEPEKLGDPTEPTVGVSVSRPDEGEGKEETLESVLTELRSLVGLDKVKEDVQTLLNFIRICRLRSEHFGNARSIRNVFEHAINQQASRLVLDSDITDEELAALTLEDVMPALEVL